MGESPTSATSLPVVVLAVVSAVEAVVSPDIVVPAGEPPPPLPHPARRRKNTATTQRPRRSFPGSTCVSSSLPYARLLRRVARLRPDSIPAWGRKEGCHTRSVGTLAPRRRVSANPGSRHLGESLEHPLRPKSPNKAVLRPMLLAPRPV